MTADDGNLVNDAALYAVTPAGLRQVGRTARPLTFGDHQTGRRELVPKLYRDA